MLLLLLFANPKLRLLPPVPLMLPLRLRDEFDGVGILVNPGCTIWGLRGVVKWASSSRASAVAVIVAPDTPDPADMLVPVEYGLSKAPDSDDRGRRALGSGVRDPPTLCLLGGRPYIVAL